MNFKAEDAGLIDSDGAEMAYPSTTYNSSGQPQPHESHKGLSKRELFAKDIACACFMNQPFTKEVFDLNGAHSDKTRRDIAKYAVRFADLLILELNKKR